MANSTFFAAGSVLTFCCLWATLPMLLGAPFDWSTTPGEPMFSQNNGTLYEYETYIMFGLPENQLDRSGVHLFAKLEILPHGQRTYQIKAVPINIKEVTGAWPKDPFSRSSRLSQILSDQLLTPVRFEYVHGLVRGLSAPAGTSEMVLNLVKGVLSLISVNIKKTQNMYDLQEIEETIQHMVQYVQDKIHLDVSWKFMELVLLIRLATPDILHATWKQFAQKSRHRTWFMQGLCMAGSADSLKFIQFLRSGDLSDTEALALIPIAIHNIRGSQKAYQISKEIIQDSRVKRSPKLFKHTYLAYGSKIKKFSDRLSSCPETYLEPLHDLAADAHSK